MNKIFSIAPLFISICFVVVSYAEIPIELVGQYGGNCEAVAIRVMPFTGKVYNLKVKGADRYLVGQNGVIVRDY